jgi:hypothetical protein
VATPRRQWRRPRPKHSLKPARLEASASTPVPGAQPLKEPSTVKNGPHGQHEGLEDHASEEPSSSTNCRKSDARPSASPCCSPSSGAFGPAVRKGGRRGKARDPVVLLWCLPPPHCARSEAPWVGRACPRGSHSHCPPPVKLTRKAPTLVPKAAPTNRVDP